MVIEGIVAPGDRREPGATIGGRIVFGVCVPIGCEGLVAHRLTSFEGSPQMVVCAVVQAPQIEERGVRLSIGRKQTEVSARPRDDGDIRRLVG